MKTIADIIFIAGAPGTGKSSVAMELQKKLKSPMFEFGWIPEFRQKGEVVIPYTEEESLSFENLSLVSKNYIKHGFSNVIITDLEDKRILELHKNFGEYTYLLITLTVADADILKSRVIDKTRTSAYRNYKEAISINQSILDRPLLPNEIRIDTTKKPVKQVTKEILKHIQH
jgi:broad-specificity NMP kinase